MPISASPYVWLFYWGSQLFYTLYQLLPKRILLSLRSGWEVNRAHHGRWFLGLHNTGEKSVAEDEKQIVDFERFWVDLLHFSLTFCMSNPSFTSCPTCT